MNGFYTTIRQWLDENLWLTIAVFFCVYSVTWVVYFVTLAVEFIFAKKTNNVERTTNKIYAFCNRLSRNILFAGVLFIVLSFITSWLLPLLGKK